MKKSSRFTPLWIAMGVVTGILIGTFYANHFSGNRLSIINTSGNKLNNLLHIIDDQYVDTVNVNDLVEKAMPQILSELDPHSVYITAREGEIANDDLRGSFSGIGIEFTIRQDTIRRRACRCAGWRQDCRGRRLCLCRQEGYQRGGHAPSEGS